MFITGTKRYNNMSTNEKLNTLVKESTPKYITLDDTEITKDDFNDCNYDIGYCRESLAKSYDDKTINKVVRELRHQGVNDAKILNYITIMINSYHDKKFSRKELANKFFINASSLKKTTEKKDDNNTSIVLSKPKVKDLDLANKQAKAKLKNDVSDLLEQLNIDKDVIKELDEALREDLPKAIKTILTEIFPNKDKYISKEEDVIDEEAVVVEDAKDKKEDKETNENPKENKQQKSENNVAAKVIPGSFGFDPDKFVKKPSGNNNESTFIPFTPVPVMNASGEERGNYIKSMIKFLPDKHKGVGDKTLNALISLLNSSYLRDLCMSNPIVSYQSQGIPLLTEVEFMKCETVNRNDYKFYIPLANGMKLYIIFNVTIKKDKKSGVMGNYAHAYINL